MRRLRLGLGLTPRPARKMFAGQADSISAASGSMGFFAPSDLSGLAWWLRADLGITLNGSTVSGWADQSAGAHDATQATPAKQPTYAASGGGNNQAHVVFSSANMEGLAANPALTVPYDWFIVFRPLATASGSLLDAGGSSLYMPGNQITWYNTGLNVFASNAHDHVIEATGNGASSILAIDGTSAGTGTQNSGIGACVIGAFTNYGSEWNGFIYEIVAYNRILSGTESQLVRNYIYARYGFSGS